MKIIKQIRHYYFFVDFAQNKSEFHYYGSLSFKDYLKYKNSLFKNQIIIFDKCNLKNSFFSNFFRKKLNLNKKDKDNKTYLIVVPNSSYVTTKFWKKCFFKSRKLINKKYFIVDYKTYDKLGISQEIFYLE